MSKPAGSTSAHRPDVGRPGVVAQLVGGAGQTADPVARLQQLGDQPPADVPRRPGDQAVQSRPAPMALPVHGHPSAHLDATPASILTADARHRALSADEVARLKTLIAKLEADDE